MSIKLEFVYNPTGELQVNIPEEIQCISWPHELRSYLSLLPCGLALFVGGMGSGFLGLAYTCILSASWLCDLLSVCESMFIHHSCRCACSGKCMCTILV